MPFGSYHVAVNDSRDEIADARESDEHLVRNKGPDSCFIGDVGVTVATGFELASGEAIGLNLRGEEKAYAICDAADTSTLHVLTE